MMRFLGADVTEASRQHAMAEYPRESCGGVTQAGYKPFQNLSSTPELAFLCDAEIEPLVTEGRLLALIHSHPDGPEAPSVRDIEQQSAMAIPWGIVISGLDAALPPYFWCDDFEPPPLIGRPFRYGPSGTDGKGDCAALVRDWYRVERGIRLPEFAREDGVWKAGDDLYRTNLMRAGFIRQKLRDGEEPAIGDVALLEIRSITEPNHAAIYVGSGLFLHHLENRLSRNEPSNRWLSHVTDWFRYAG
jgi:proteasome lid subunit RPN8/RPN11